MTDLKPYTDETILHYGTKHRGKKLANVPANYLIFIYEQDYTMPAQLKAYIRENLDALKTELKREIADFKRDWRNSAR